MTEKEMHGWNVDENGKLYWVEEWNTIEEGELKERETG